MRIKGEIIEAKYFKGVSASTGNSYEMAEYVMQIMDEQGHFHRLVFSLFNQQMYKEAIHKGDKVEVSISLGIRESNLRKFNSVQYVNFVQKLNSDWSNTKEYIIERQVQVQEQRAQAQAKVQAAVETGDALPF